MTREQLGVLLDAKDKLCDFCPAVECENCYVPRLIEKHKRAVAETAPVQHGEWINHNSYVECSLCGAMPYNRSSYCPNCGAKMDLKEREG